MLESELQGAEEMVCHLHRELQQSNFAREMLESELQEKVKAKEQSFQSLVSEMENDLNCGICFEPCWTPFCESL